MQLTNRAVKAGTRIEKDATVILFALSAFWICFPSNLMKNLTKKY